MMYMSAEYTHTSIHTHIKQLQTAVTDTLKNPCSISKPVNPVFLIPPLPTSSFSFLFRSYAFSFSSDSLNECLALVSVTLAANLLPTACIPTPAGKPERQRERVSEGQGTQLEVKHTAGS